ncbi:MAG: hypothetical protein J7L08_00535 [Candidatus Aenigmarchaeota archaeon]|nr:hypothetical protein [Candidatus Aenigmarchaeota archaeon]
MNYLINQTKNPIFLFFTRIRENQKRFLLAFSFLLVILLIAFINITSLISFALFLLVSIAVYRLLFDRNIKKIARLFVFYSLIAIGLYLLQYAAFPEYKGFSGGLGWGTDDARYFEGAVGSTPIAFQLPGNLAHHPFAKLLRIIANILPIKNIHLFDLLFFNIFGMSFIPVFTSNVAYILTKEKKVANLAGEFSMICPIMMVNGLILVRDGWTAVLFIGAIYFLLTNRYILLATTSALLFYIRVASGMLLIIALLLFIYYKFQSYKSDYLKKTLLFMIGVVVIFSVSAVCYPIVSKYAVEKKITQNILFRENYMEFMKNSVELKGGTSIAYTIYSKPAYLRIPLGFVFFLCEPFLTIKGLSFHGIYIPRGFLLLCFPVLFIFYFKYLVQGIIYISQNEKLAMRVVAFVFFLLLLMVSQMSLQMRHKTMVMPLFYILVAYGFYNKTKLGEMFGIVGAFSLIFVQLVVNIIRIV